MLRYLVGCAELPAEVNRALRRRRPRRPHLPRDDAPLRRGRRAAPPRDRAGAGALARGCPATGSNVVTPVPAALARPLVESLVQRGGRAPSTTSPGTCPTRPRGCCGFDEAVRLALQRIRDGGGGDAVVVRLRGRAPRPTRCRPTRTGPAARSTSTSAQRRSTPRPTALWRVVEGIGGEHGWYSFPLGLGASAAGSTGSSAASGCAAAAATRTACGSATPWTGGGSRSSSRARCCACGPRCGCPGGAWLELGVEKGDDGGDGAPPARRVRPARARRSRVLVGGRAVPRLRVRRHARNITGAAERARASREAEN